MQHRIWTALAVLLAIGAGCGGSSPSAPTSTTSSSSSSFQGSTVSAIDGHSLAGITVTMGSQRTVSDATGTFRLDNVTAGQSQVFTAPSVVERHTMAAEPSTGPTREALIPTDFDLEAFDQMFRGAGRIERWTSAPALVVITTVMNYETSFNDGQNYHATSEQLTTAEADELQAQLTDALAFLTGGTFTGFASVERESAASGSLVNTLRAGKIVVGRYKGLQGLLNTIGFGRRATDASGQMTGGAIYLDRDFDKNNDERRLLRMHELGHALGYNHVTVRTSIMNPAIGPEPTTFDRQGAIVAFQRMPGNQSPDTDPSEASSRTGGGLFGITPSTAIWSAPVF